MVKRLTYSCVAFFIFLSPFATSTSVKQTLVDTLEHYVEESEPGCAIAYGDASGTFFYEKGVLESGQSTLLTSTTPFITASTTKQFTAHLAILLAEREQLSLNDSSKQYYPELASKEKITIADLMNHTSGIPEHWSLFELQGRTLTEEYAQQDGLYLLENNLALEFTPGNQFSYSNGGYLALTQVIEKRSGKSINEVLNQYINQKLNIDAWYLDGTEQLPKVYAKGHLKRGLKFKSYLDHTYLYGPGNLVINATDFSKWARYLNQQLTEMPVYINAIAERAKNNHYFAGLYIASDSTGKTFFQHSGYYRNYTQSIVLIPQTQQYALALCNRADFRPGKVTHDILAKLGALKFEINLADYLLQRSEVLSAGIYINEARNDVMMINNEERKSYYYGKFVGSPKLLKAIDKDYWLIQLSTKKINIERIDKQSVLVSNPQNASLYKLVNQDFTKPTLAMPQQSYINAVIGEIEFTYARSGQINFIDSVGKIALQCSAEYYCWSEEGDVVVNVINKQKL